jgi:hypothetical protein
LTRGSSEALAGDCEHALNLGAMLGCLESRVAKEGMNRREAQVAAADTDTLMVLQVIKEGNDQRRIDFLEVQARRRLMQCSFGELQQLPKCVAIGTDRVGACLPLLHQALGKKALQQRRQAGGLGHVRSSQRRSRRRIASFISSGDPLRYHWVSATWTWPRQVDKMGRSRSGSCRLRTNAPGCSSQKHAACHAGVGRGCQLRRRGCDQRHRFSGRGNSARHCRGRPASLQCELTHLQSRTSRLDLQPMRAIWTNPQL